MENLIKFLPAALIVIAVLIIMAIGYIKAPPDKAIIISGPRKKPKILIGRAGVKIPFLERRDTLILKQISIDIKTDGYIPTKDFIGVSVDAIAKIKIKADDEGLPLAMKNFLNMSEKQIIEALADSLQGNMREIIGTIDLKEISTEKESFGNQLQEKAQKDMNALGIEIISCNIQKISDEQGLINDLGQDNMAQIKKNAAIAKANAERDIAMAQAIANKESNDAKVKSDTEIAIKQNELAIKKAELKKEADIKQAEADAAYKIQEEEQRKVIEIASTNADIAKQEREVELKTKEALVKEQELEAQIKKTAEAKKYAEQQEADVALYKRQKEAEAKRYEEEQQAEALRKKAEADKFAKEQEAAGILAVGKAEAESIKLKGIAEAEGIDKKAEAMKKMGEASVLEMFFNAYPSIMEAAAKPLENVDQITMFGEGNGSKLVGDIVNSTKQVAEGIKSSTGIDIQAVLSGFLGSKLNNSTPNEATTPVSSEKNAKEIVNMFDEKEDTDE